MKWWKWKRRNAPPPPREVPSCQYGSEDQCAAFFQHLPAAAWVADAEGKPIFVSPSAGNVFGIPAEEFTRRNTFFDLVHPEDKDRVRAAYLALFTGEGTYDSECRLTKADGSWIWVHNRAISIITRDGVRYAAGLSVENTRRKQVELALRESEQFAQATIDAIGSQLCVLDEKGSIVAVNQAWREFATTNRPPETDENWWRRTVDGVNYLDVCLHATGPDAEEATRMAAGIRNVIDGRQDRYSLEYPCHSPTEQRWFCAEVTAFAGPPPRHVVIKHRTVTERKLAQDALRQSEERYRSLVGNIPDVVWSADDSGTCVYITANCAEVLGMTREQICGQSPEFWLASVNEEDRTQVRERFRALIANQGPFDVEFRFQRPDGRWMWIHDRALHTYERDGRTYADGLISDITARKQIEDQLRGARQSAEAANEAKSRFLANMSHEIRTPMNGVVGMIQLLLTTPLTAEQRGYAAVAQDSARTLLSLIDGILDLSKIEARQVVLEPLDFDLRIVIATVCQILSIDAHRKGLNLHWQIAPEIPQLLHGDAHRLRQVLTNLIGNAIKFTEHGEVQINARVAGQGGSRTAVRFAVSDTGIGVPHGGTANIFSPFVQADGSITRKYGGTGLGLAISAELVKLMSGEIGVDSEQGRGSTFWFTVPFDAAVQNPVPASGPDAARVTALVDAALPTGTTETHHRRILLAEDNSTNQIVILAQLSKLGYEADAVETGQQAVEAVGLRDYDLILMDCAMPGMNGFEAARAIRQSIARPIPIIAVTAAAMTGDRDRCLREGMDDYLPKPVELEDLKTVLGKWLPQPADDPSSAVELASAAPRHVCFDEQALLKRLMQDRNLAAVAVGAFLTDFGSQLARLNAHLEAADCDAVWHQAHKMKGAASAVSAVRLRALAAEIEEAARAGDLGSAVKLRQPVIDEFEDVKLTLEQWKQHL